MSGALGMPEHMFWWIQAVGRLLLVQLHHPEGDEGVEDLEDEGGVHQAIVVELAQEPDHAGPPLVVLLPVHLHPHPDHAIGTLNLQYVPYLAVLLETDRSASLGTGTFRTT